MVDDPAERVRPALGALGHVALRALAFLPGSDAHGVGLLDAEDLVAILDEDQLAVPLFVPVGFDLVGRTYRVADHEGWHGRVNLGGHRPGVGPVADWVLHRTDPVFASHRRAPGHTLRVARPWGVPESAGGW